MAFCINHRQILFALSSGHAHSRGESYIAVCVQRERDRESQRAKGESKGRERERDYINTEATFTTAWAGPMLISAQATAFKAVIYTSFNLDV